MRGTSTARRVHPITMEVVRSALIAATREMGITLMRTSYSPIFSEGLDFSCALFDRRGELVGQAEFCPVHLSAMRYSVEWAIKEVGVENFEPGDVVIHNDPYRGGTHISDFTFIRPVFKNSELIAFSTNRAHQLDVVGGTQPGGFMGNATSIFQEGVRIPPIKAWKRGEEVVDIWKLMLSNMRLPRQTAADMRAQAASCITGERRVLQLADKYGLETFELALEDIKDYSERRMRAEIAKIPEGVYEAEDWLDDDGIEAKPIRLKVKVSVKGDGITFDYRGTDRQTQGPINAVYAVTASMTYNALLMLTDPTIPMNHGCYRPVDLIVPPTTVLNADYPSPVFGGNTDTANRVVEVIFLALAPVIPKKVSGAEYGTSMNLTGGGIDPRTSEYYAFYRWANGGWGGRFSHDGNSCVVNPDGNCKNVEVEVWETKYPFTFVQYGLAPESAGPGKHRGGYGEVMVMRMDGEQGTLSGIGERNTIPPWGIFGGKAARLKSAYLFKKAGDREWRNPLFFGAHSPSKFAGLPIAKGDLICMVGGGGGGYGDPLDRDPQLVREEVVGGYISTQTALEEYGVVIDPRTSELKLEETKRAREKGRSERGELQLIDRGKDVWARPMNQQEIARLGLKDW